MPSRTRRTSRSRSRSSRKQRGGFLDWLFGSSTNSAANAEKKNEEMLAPPVSPNAVPEVNGMATPAAGGRRKRSHKSRKGSRKAKRSHKSRKASRRH